MSDWPADPTEPGISREEWRLRLLAERDHYRKLALEVPWQLLDAALELRTVQGELERVADRFHNIAAQARAEGRPTVQILHMKGEIETLAKIIDDTVLDMLPKIAEVEAKSLG